MARRTRLLEKLRLSPQPGRTRGRGRPPRPAAVGPVGRYVLRKEIGRGAMGEVWRAEDPGIGRAVAVKILRIPEGLSPSQVADWDQRFLREARAAGVLSHPGIVTVHDVGVTADDRPFIVMELVEGRSLDAIVRAGPRPTACDGLEWGAQVAEALNAAHDRGIVHRDVKPANILIDQQGRARITDFGIARLAESDLTQAGSFLGSPAFSSPEQILGGTTDGRSDLFSLGATLYLLLTGERPFRGDDLSSLTYAICHLDPIPMRELSPRLPAAVDAVVMRALAKDPQRRFPAGREMAEYLRAAAELMSEPEGARAPVQPPPARRVRPARAPAPVRGAMITLLALTLAGALGVSVLTRGLSTGRQAAPASPSRRTAASLGAPSSGPWAAGNESALTAVALRVAHDLDEGTVTVWSGPRRLLRAPLRRNPRAEGEGNEATWTKQDWTIRLPQGDHVLRVEVSSADGRIHLEGGTSGAVRAGGAQRLHVRVKQRPGPKIDLQWTSS